MIPKIIHYCWFGKNPHNDLIKKCIASWQKQLPDYEIFEWNEDNIDTRNSEFMSICYEEKKWAYVADYARLLALKEYGGIYLDTDMEVIKVFPEDFLNYDFIAGEEVDGQVSCGLLGAKANNPDISDLIDYYDQLLLLEPIPIHLQEILIKNNKFNDPNYFIAKPDQFYPKKYNGDMVDLKNSFTIHHWEGSWKPDKNVFFANFISKRNKIFSLEEEQVLIKAHTTSCNTLKELTEYENIILKNSQLVNGKLKMNLENKLKRNAVSYVNNKFIDPTAFSINTAIEAINNPYLKGYSVAFYFKLIIKSIIRYTK